MEEYYRALSPLCSSLCVSWAVVETFNEGSAPCHQNSSQIFLGSATPSIVVDLATSHRTQDEQRERGDKVVPKE